MHDLKMIEKEVEQFKANLAKRNFDTSEVDKLLSLNESRKELIQKVESSQAQVKKLSKEVGMKKKNGEDATEIMNEVASIKNAMASDSQKLEDIKVELDNLLATFPNLLEEDTPVGNSEDDNVEVNKWGKPKEFNFEVKDHVDIGEGLGLLDFEAAGKITGARFVIYKGALARLERALANFFLDFHLENGYEEIIPPLMVHERSMFGTGQLPKFAEDSFKIEGFPWYMIATSEIPVTNMKRETVMDEAELPLRYTAFTPCFRSEAGSHGKDTRGLIRMHQFNKVEMVNITKAEDSDAALASMVKSAETLLEKLELPFRTVRLCSGDIGFGARKTFDLEVWVPSQGKYREISSCSNCGDFQARRASIRYKKQGEKPQFAHTLNGSGLAVGRTFVAILENYQNEDGSITVPKVLEPYMGGLTRIDKNK